MVGPKKPSCPVWLYVVREPAPRFHALLRELGFRAGKKTPNWWRHYDDRISGQTVQRGAVQEWCAERKLELVVRPQRRTRAKATTFANSIPSASEWLRKNDPKYHANKLAEKRKRTKDAAQAARNTVIVYERRKALKLL